MATLNGKTHFTVEDGFYFAVATLTTSSIADPELVITNSWLKVFTAFYVLVGIGILVEVARQLGFAMIELQQQDRAAKAREGGKTPSRKRLIGDLFSSKPMEAAKSNPRKVSIRALDSRGTLAA